MNATTFHIKERLSDFATDISVETYDEEGEEYAIYFTLEIDDNTGKYLDIPNSAVMINGTDVTEFSVRLGDFDAELVEDCADSIPRRKSAPIHRIHNGGKMNEHTMHLETLNTRMPSEEFVDMLEAFLNEFESRLAAAA